LSRFDVTAGAGAGIQWKRFSFEAGYDFGLLNRASGGSGSSDWHRDQLNVRFGYSF